MSHLRPDPRLTTDALAERLQRALGEEYVLERELGGGGMSRVFVAHHVKLARSVVIKVLNEELAESLSHDRFSREIMLSATLQHPHIVPVLDAGEAGNLPFFVMPFVEGESLRVRLTRDGPLSIPHAVSILRDVARALAFAHARGVVHRDIKPDNVLLAHGSALVADFGVAKAVQTARTGGRERGPAAGAALTSFGTTLGTPAYMAPEQVAGDPDTDHRADLYALGATAYEMLTGQLPHPGRTPAEVLTAKLSQAPVPASRLRPAVPAPLEEIVMRCLAREPAERPQRAEDIVAQLDDPSVVSGALASRELSVVRGPGRRRFRLTALAAGMLLVATVGAWLATRPGGPTPASVSPVAPLPAVAVLPLVGISADSSDGHIALGLTDELTTALARAPGIRVASRSAAAAALADGLPVQELARRLGVTFLLEGTVQHDGSRLRVAVRLVNSADGFMVWSDLFEGTTEDLLSVQAEIAAAIASAIGADLADTGGGESASGVGASGTRDLEAYNEYLRGHYLLEQRGSLDQAAAAFGAAIGRDSGFARAWAELAQTYAIMPLYRGVSRESVWPQARMAAERAIRLDSTLATAHAALGVIYNGELRWADAQAALERATEVDSSYAPAWQWLGENALLRGDLEAAALHFDRAAGIDPASPLIAALRALTLGLRGQYDSAVARARAAVARDPALMSSRLMLGTIHLYASQAGDAVRELEAALATAPGTPVVLGALGYAYAVAGDRARAVAIADTLAAAPERAGAWSALAKVRVGLGDREGAVNALQRALAVRDPFFSSEPLAAPIYDSLRDDPRFVAVVRAAGLDPRLIASRRAAPPSR